MFPLRSSLGIKTVAFMPSAAAMSLQRQELTLLDFDHTCTEQPRLLARFPHRQLDLSSLTQSNLFCSESTFRRICGVLPPSVGNGVTLLGCGDYHYVALALLPLQPRPFTLVLVDHHTDCYEGAIAAMLSCGSWIRHAFHRLPGLARVVMIGPSAAGARDLPDHLRRRIRIFPDTAELSVGRLLASIPTDDVHLSIDKDALSPTEVLTNWDQGCLTLDRLLPLITALLRAKNVCGADLCGEWPATPLDLLRPEVRATIARNEEANLRLVETLLGTG
jgi:hypothetical protein